jgi:hypothetical protein
MNIRPIDRKEVISLLTQDDYYRKQRKWPLITRKDIKNARGRNISDDLFSMESMIKTKAPAPLTKIINEINSLYPFTNELLDKFQNNLIACGGSICKSILNYDFHRIRSNVDDIDFFFYDLDIYQANKMRIEIIEYMITIWKSHVGKDVIRYHNDPHINIELKNKVLLQDVKFYIQRNEYVTTLHVEELCDFDENPRVYMYQFIHRIYPDISSIIGGFDLSASAIAYDGKEIYTTPLGAWSLTNKSIIIDMGRRSTSYEHRLGKYIGYGFNLIFPGLTKNIINDKLTKTYNNGSFSKFREKIEELANDNGYMIDTEFDLSEVFYKRRNEHKSIDEYDLLAFYKLQKQVNILPYLILNINSEDDISIKQSNGNQYDWYNDERDGGKCSDKSYYLKRLSDYGNDEKYILNLSDYSHNHMYYKHVSNANATRLRLGNLNTVVSILYIDNHENIKEKLINESNNPNLGINDFVIELYKKEVNTAIEKYKNNIKHKWNCQQGELFKSFGLLTNEFLNGKDPVTLCDLMIENINKNNKICKNNLTGIKWITENPGRQWTSSINPIFKDPRDWYGKYYTPVFVGIPPEIETCLRLMKLEKTESVWSILPEDMFNLLLSYILKSYSDEAWEYI